MHSLAIEAICSQPSETSIASRLVLNSGNDSRDERSTGFDLRVIDVGAVYLVSSPPELGVHEVSQAGAYFMWR